jgi:aryl-alcohol dehydrogenase-like predicted oxidoreductase
MKYTSIKGLQISKLSLGTAQLGFDYGIANTRGKPTLEQSFKILETAVNAGINCFDTAFLYGDSEEIIGSFISRRMAGVTPIIITKLKAFEFSDGINLIEIHNQVNKDVEESMRRLQINKIPICLLHNASNMTDNDGKILQSLMELRDKGLIEKIGVSVYSPEEVEQAINIKEFDAIQIPINLFDHRLIDAGLLKSLEQHDFIVFARSVYLQGLFFLNPANLPHNLKLAKEPLEILKKISEEHEIGIDELALAFVRDLPGISSLVIGAETSTQVLKNCSLIDCPEISKELRGELSDAFSESPVEILNPTLWTE